MKTLIRFLGLMFLLTVSSPLPAQVTQYDFLKKAVQKYNEDPNEKTEKKLREAEKLANDIDVVLCSALLAIPLVFFLYFLVRGTNPKKKISSRQKR